jgi:hypothetical protein
MNEREHEILCRLLIDLFLESPRSRIQQDQQDSVQDKCGKASTDARGTKDRHLGGIKNGCQSKKAKKAV